MIDKTAHLLIETEEVNLNRPLVKLCTQLSCNTSCSTSSNSLNNKIQKTQTPSKVKTSDNRRLQVDKNNNTHCLPHRSTSSSNASGKSAKSVANQNNNNHSVVNSRRRRNQQEIRHIKRAHRHLLTSSGVPLPPSQHQQPPSSSPTSTAVTALSKPASDSSSSPHKRQKKKKTKRKTDSSSHHHEQQHHQQQHQQLRHHHQPNTHSHRNCKSSSRNKSNKSNNITSQNNTNNKCNRKSETFCDDSATIVSVISSQWCSIEERLNLLDKLLYCDEYDDYNDDDGGYEYNDDDDVGNYSTLSNCDDLDITMSDHSGSGQLPMKRRGHQHHPRFAGQRRSNVPVEEILAALRRGDSVGELSNLSTTSTTTADSTSLLSGSSSALGSNTISHLDEDVNGRCVSPTEIGGYDKDFDDLNRNELSSSNCDENYLNDINNKKTSLDLPLLHQSAEEPIPTTNSSPTPTDESSLLDDAVKTPSSSSSSKQKSPKKEKTRSDKKKKRTKTKNPAEDDGATTPAMERADGDGAPDTETPQDDESAEWAKLRCTSERTEVIAEREIRRHKGRCADYPGLAFGRSIFSSDTMMKFNIIRNELHNIMNTQLKRVKL